MMQLCFEDIIADHAIAIGILQQHQIAVGKQTGLGLLTIVCGAHLSKQPPEEYRSRDHRRAEE